MRNIEKVAAELLKISKNFEEDESLAPYRDLAEDFGWKLHVRNEGVRVRYFGSTASAGPFIASSPLDAQKLAAWLKKANVNQFVVSTKGIYLQWKKAR